MNNDNKDTLLAQMVLLQMGLENRNGRLYDPDSRCTISFKGKEVVTPGSNINNTNTIEFDPYNNPRLMNKLFSYHVDKVTEDASVFYNIEDGNGKGHIELRDGDEVLKSESYQRESLRYMDLILQLNDISNTDLTEMDSTPIKHSNTVKPKRKKG